MTPSRATRATCLALASTALGVAAATVASTQVVPWPGRPTGALVAAPAETRAALPVDALTRAAGALAAAPTDAAPTGPAGSVIPSAAASRVTGAGAVVALPRWHWPLTPRPDVLRRFVAPVSPYGSGHRGLDLAAAPGTPVLAVEAGRVTHAGTVAGRGTVTVQHAGGLRSTYEPVRSSLHAGDLVGVGEVVGVVEGRSGGSVDAALGAHCGARSCLHLGARRDAGYLDPWPLLTGGLRIRLLPLAATGLASG